jgi:hypothetical protein
MVGLPNDCALLLAEQILAAEFLPTRVRLFQVPYVPQTAIKAPKTPYRRRIGLEYVIERQ